jgi:hypothetical protein
MRIVRYELEIVEYQQIQPLWPGRLLAVKPGRYQEFPYGDPRWMTQNQKIDMWCIDDSGNGPRRPPILGVWIVGTGHPMPEAIVNPAFGKAPPYAYDGGPRRAGVEFEDTCVMANGLEWHVFTSVVGYVQTVETGYGEVSSADDIASKVADRRRDEMQSAANMAQEYLDAKITQGPPYA